VSACRRGQIRAGASEPRLNLETASNGEIHPISLRFSGKTQLTALCGKYPLPDVKSAIIYLCPEIGSGECDYDIRLENKFARRVMHLQHRGIFIVA
jgi:hypothetical protein